MTSSGPSGDSKRAILEHLKRIDSESVSMLAQVLGVTPTAVRQHLETLSDNGLVEQAEQVATGGRGRPAARWRLTVLAGELFPDRHADLTVELIDAIREAVGEEGLDAVIATRTAGQKAAYSGVVTGSDLESRVAELARQRAAEGYMAEVVPLDDGSFELIEHHCPICEAAASCQALCRDELGLFRDVVGPSATIERTNHLLSGDQRCAYIVTPVQVPVR